MRQTIPGSTVPASRPDWRQARHAAIWLAMPLLFVAHQASATVEAVGRTPGTFSVDAVGAATYTIPIDVAPGVNGLRPTIALTYDSQAGDGPLGMRWNLAGFSVIARCAKTVATNTVARGVLSGDDQFCLDGQPLVRDAANSGSADYGANGTMYRTELDSYVRVISYGSTNGGPTYFEARLPNGITRYYGNTTDSRIAAGTGTGAPTRFWKVNQIQDKYFNSIRFTYKDAAGDFYPDEVRWTDHCSSAGCASGTGNRYKLSFEYETRPTEDQRSGYVAGHSWSHSKRLQRIVYWLDTTIVQDYTLDYIDPVTTATNRSHLAAVTQCGDTATGCLTATAFEWADGVAGWGSFVDVPEGLATSSATFLYGDFDGDGRTDILLEDDDNPGKWSVFRATGNPTTPYVRSDTTTSATSDAIVGDFNADGLTDVLGVDSGAWVIQASNGSLTGAAFDTTQTSISTSTISDPTALDYNGDGLPDLAYVRGTTLYMRENTGGAFSTTEITADGLVEDYLPSGFSFLPMDGSLSAADFDGDGREDLLVHYTGASSNDRWFAYAYRGTVANPGAWDIVGITPIDANVRTVLPLDINGDGLSDLAYYQDNTGTSSVPGWSTMLSTGLTSGNGFTAPDPIADTGRDEVSNSDTRAAVVDYDGDGRDDLLLSLLSGGRVNLSDGATITDTSITLSGWGYTAGLPLLTTNANGDGAQDIWAVWLEGGPSNIHPVWHLAFHQSPVGTLAPVGDLVTSVTDGLQNAVTEITYRPLTDSASGGVYTASDSGDYVPSPAPGSLANHLVRGSAQYVVGAYTTNNGVGGTHSLTYHYTNGWQNTQGRGFLGFRRVEQSGGPSGALESSTVYRQDFPFTGGIVEQATCQQPSDCSATSGTRVTTRVSTWSSHGESFGSDADYTAVWEDHSDSAEYELNGSTVRRSTSRDLSESTDWNYALGAPNEEEITVRAGTSGPEWQTTRSYTYGDSNLVAAWCLGLPTQVDESRQNPGESALSRQVRVSYLGTCKILAQEVGPASSPKTLKTWFDYDSYGNPETRVENDVTTPSDSRRTEYEYTDGPYHPSSEIRVIAAAIMDECQMEVLVEQSDLRTQFAWDYRLGLLAGETSPQGVEVTRAYDSFGRPKSEDQATRGVSTAISYQACSSCFPTHSAYQVTAYPTVGPYSITYFDSFGRQVGQATVLLDGSESRSATRYNALGQMVERDVPYLAGATSYYVSYEYDEIGRLTKETRPTGQNVNTSDPTETNYSYSGLTTTVTDAEDRQRKLIANANGTLQEVQEDPSTINAITSYEYWPFGELKKITDAGNTVNGTFARAVSNFTYDARGFLISRSDADRGTWTFDYDAWGAVVSQIQPNGRQDVTYDPAGRPITRTDKDTSGNPQLTTTWEYYGNAGGQTGQLEKVTTGAYHEESYTYYTSGAMLGLPQQVTTEFPQVTEYPAFDTDYGYDAYGRLQTVTYPELWDSGRFEARYAYSTTGYLASVCQAGGGYCVNNLYAVDTVGSSVPVDALGRITHAYFGSSSSGPHETYTYDPANMRLSAIQTTGAASQDYGYEWDRVGNLTQRTRPNVQEDFTYDALNRLDLATRTADSTTTTTMDLAYDKNGNITSKLANGSSGSDVGDYYYGTTTGGPHAVSNISGNRGGTFHYDAAGNLDCMSWSSGACNSGSSVVWTVYNLPSRIEYTSTSTYADFSYGPNRERVRTTEHEGSGVRVLYHVGPHFEVEATWNWSGAADGTRIRSTILFGQRPVYVRVEDPLESSSLEEGYLHLDHLGSVDQVTNIGGIAGTTSLSFDAFGKRRNTDWSNDDNDARFADDQWTERGYTGHQHLDTVRLIHMNGRVQHPIWGRMLSPDPILGRIEAPQSLNPYTYASNNPLRLVDPTGYTSVEVTAPPWPTDDGKCEHAICDPDELDAFATAIDKAFLDANGWYTTNWDKQFDALVKLNTVPTKKSNEQEKQQRNRDNSRARNNFVNLGIGVVGATTTAGGVFGSWVALAELPAATAIAMTGSSETAFLLTATALSDVGAMGLFVGAPLGAASGVVMLIPLGVGYAAGTAMYPSLDKLFFHPAYDHFYPYKP